MAKEQETQLPPPGSLWRHNETGERRFVTEIQEPETIGVVHWPRCLLYAKVGEESTFFTMVNCWYDWASNATRIDAPGLRDAAEKMVEALNIDTPNAIVSAAFGIRTALEGSSDGR